MKVELRFPSSAEASLELNAETDAEKAILAFLAEGYDRRWRAVPNYSYRAGGVPKLKFVPVEGEVK